MHNKQRDWHWLLTMILISVLWLVSCSAETTQQEPATTNTTQTETDHSEAHEEEEIDEHEDEHENEHTDEHEDEHAHEDEHNHEDEHDHEAEAEVLELPELEAVDLSGGPLKVVATTSIIGDVVAQVGGETIELTTLMAAGQDPHSYEPGAQDLTAVAQAHVIFVNGWDLEEALVHDLEEIGEEIPLVPISANIEPLTVAEGDTHDEAHSHSGADPHVWFNIGHVEQWVTNAQHILSDLDPANADLYSKNATTYLNVLDLLEGTIKTQLAQIPSENRFLVTNHDSLSYFAQAYDFTILGTVIPGVSTVAEPSASDVADLIESMKTHNLCTIFTETTVSDNLAQTVAAELNNCDTVQVLQLYTGSIGPADSNANSYIYMFQANVETIVNGLQ